MLHVPWQPVAVAVHRRKCRPGRGLVCRNLVELTPDRA
jgi:hypothetical protein